MEQFIHGKKLLLGVGGRVADGGGDQLTWVYFFTFLFSWLIC